MDIQVIKVTNSREMKKFINFPLDLYKSDQNFVFEPYLFQKVFFSEKNPFFEHSKADYFLAISGSEVVGRIAAINNTVHNETYREKTGFFGFFEVIEDYEVAKQLLDRVVVEHTKNGFDRMVGTTNFSTNDSCGILISGFDIDPVILMPYNKSYYAGILEIYGLEKLMDLSSYSLENKSLEPFFSRSAVKRAEEKLKEYQIQIRPIDFKNFKTEITRLRHVYNSSNKDNWGFVPLNENEFEAMAKDLKRLLPASLVLLAEHKNDLVGFIVALPNYNQVFKKIKHGKLFPSGILKYLWYKRKIKSARIMILGVDESSRNKGVDLVLYKQITASLNKLGIYEAEACYVMANNQTMNSLLVKMGGKDLKKYRIYSFHLPAIS
jgi:hypothetical protein